MNVLSLFSSVTAKSTSNNTAEKLLDTKPKKNKSFTSTIVENLNESFGLMWLGQTSVNSLFNHSQCSNGVLGCKLERERKKEVRLNLMKLTIQMAGGK